MRQYKLTKADDEVTEGMSLKDVLEETDFDDEETDQLADLEVGKSMTLDEGEDEEVKVERTA